MLSSILVVDDDDDFMAILKIKLLKIGYPNVRLEVNPLKAAAAFSKGNCVDLALIDMTMPEMEGIELLEHIKNTCPTTECIMVTAVNEASVAVECLRKGAYDYLVKPVSSDTLALAINRALERKRLLDILDIEKKSSLPKLVYADTFKPIVTQSPKILRILKEAELHAQSDVPILITGESGTGKELLAQAIHCASPRSKFRFTPVNMASVSPTLFESEFFGHTRGAFTGADKGRSGYLEHTEGGTIFLDEIGTMPIDHQGKLLRVLQDGEFIKLGDNRNQKADVRFVAATNENLERLMSRREFRKDLYYRIRGGWLHLPPLRERTEDIPLLVDRFLKDVRGRQNNTSVSPDAMCCLMEYDYPGNVRELKSIIHSAANLAQGQPIESRNLPTAIRKKSDAVCLDKNLSSEIVPLAQVEREHILNIYHQTDRNKSKTARLLGIGLNTLRRKLKTYGET
ncbi:MAG: sigma-54-dependent Fis family transcriptional regulator [Desulfobacterales bacterium]|nr:sigma-54-dependent Fis family transcriptional regulator [Desulfobacterales bacterium]